MKMKMNKKKKKKKKDLKEEEEEEEEIEEERKKKERRKAQQAGESDTSKWTCLCRREPMIYCQPRSNEGGTTHGNYVRRSAKRKKATESKDMQQPFRLVSWLVGGAAVPRIQPVRP